MLTPAQLKQCRAALGFTQKDLADAIGFAPRGVQNIESETNPKPCQLQTMLAIECLFHRKRKIAEFKKILES
jgi:DNA-binding XRE family transcriptional regulator